MNESIIPLLLHAPSKAREKEFRQKRTYSQTFIAETAKAPDSASNFF
jgi:hypothetical protein